jgi:type III secretory pathway component EscR
MRRLVSTALSFSMFVALPIMVGCDREIKRDETTVQHSDGSVTHEETVKKVAPNGDVVTEQSKQTNNP